jgi:uncharacterized RDD family membrane protein YckC
VDEELPLTPSAPTPSPPEGKRFFPRALAYIIDIILVNVLTYGIGYALGRILFLTLYFVGGFLGFEPTIPGTISPILPFLVGLVLSIAYFTIFETLYGASPGKVVLRMRVISLDGTPPRLDSAIVRSAWRLIDGLFLGLVAASSMKPPMRQRYGDKRAKTVVVAVDSRLVTFRPSILMFVLAALVYALVSTTLQLLAILPYVKFTELR